MSVRVERQSRVATVILDRPEVRNAVDGPTAAALFDTFDELDTDEGVAVVVLWGSGGTFCSGADLSAIGTEHGNRVDPGGPGPMGPSRMVMSKPTIAAIEGYAVAGGLELALWCDLRVAAEDAVFGVLCRRWGVPLIDGGTVRLPRIVGLSRALDLILTGREVTAEEGKQIGLVDRLVPAGATRQEAEALAHQIASYPQVCMRNDRLSVYESIGCSTEEAMHNEFLRGMDSIANGDMVGGIDRFHRGEHR
ncbi:Enoyl-CoA hydratase @ Enoyl-CoA hydratase EchA5 [hydrothermal vent metagenome]|uniref:Enoyl-CoA hydratase @ Enoyl-CoA hydratase EchA5 n=1 Tax=hydrothermal vent metagenome TaxID=652676 RepID=A0A3B0S0G7_9ZZZZ